MDVDDFSKVSRNRALEHTAHYTITHSELYVKTAIGLWSFAANEARGKLKDKEPQNGEHHNTRSHKTGKPQGGTGEDNPTQGTTGAGGGGAYHGVGPGSAAPYMIPVRPSPPPLPPPMVPPHPPVVWCGGGLLPSPPCGVVWCGCGLLPPSLWCGVVWFGCGLWWFPPFPPCGVVWVGWFPPACLDLLGVFGKPMLMMILMMMMIIMIIIITIILVFLWLVVGYLLPTCLLTMIALLTVGARSL